MRKVESLRWLVLLMVTGCTEPSESQHQDSPAEVISWQDYACTETNDCVIKDVPTCCGKTVETGRWCVNSAYTPPTSVDCSQNTVCADRIIPTSCECAPYESDDTEVPEMMCDAKTADSGV